MPLNDIIKAETRKSFKGKFGRKILRNMAKKAIVEQKGQLINPIGYFNSRRERKKMSKALKIPFTPRYNGLLLEQKSELIPNEKGYLDLITTLVRK